MITSIHGTLLAVNESSVIVQPDGVGLSFEVIVPMNIINMFAAETGQHISLHTYFQVKEDAMVLFGFTNLEEKHLFQLLMSVSGVGPRLALNIISLMTPEALANAINQDQPEVIARVPGLGKKTAQKLIFELRGKLLPDGVPPGLAAASNLDAELIDALTGLGYSIVEAQAAVQSVPKDAPQNVEERLVIALAYFDGRQG